MRIGFSLSPGGLLLPYHLGVLDALRSHALLDTTSPIAGSSAGAIATCVCATGINSIQVLDATIEISQRAEQLGGVRGRLLLLLREQLQEMIQGEEMQQLESRDGLTGIAYKEIFPQQRNVLQTSFVDKNDLINAICHSSMFPFFSTNWPCAMAAPTNNGILPRLVVDGYFTVGRERFGCPDFEQANVNVDRTITISVFPQDSIGLNASSPEDCISPEVDDDRDAQMQRLFRLATQSSTRKELTEIYESGWKDADRWCRVQKT